MRAKVQYYDVVGTVAADVADGYSNSLQTFLEKTFDSYDGNRFFCRGCITYIGERNMVSISFICYDKENNEFVRFSPKDWNIEDFFNLFKRFEIVLGRDMDKLCSVDEMQEILLDNNQVDVF